MKKIISAVIAMLCTSMIFAQSQKYQELLAKAKDFEAQKKWVSAMATYGDAIIADSENCTEAIEKFNAIKKAFDSGKPGLDKYTSRMLHDEWKKVLIEYEQYYGSHMTSGIKVYSVEGDAHALTYTVSFKLSNHGPYSDITYALKNGYGSAREDSWTDLPRAYTANGTNFLYNLEGWPKASASIPAGSTPKKINQDMGYTLVTANTAYNVNGAYVLGFPGYAGLAQLGTPASYAATGIIEYRNPSADGWYDMTFKFVDKEGNSFGTSARIFTKCADYEMLEVKITGLTGEQFDKVELGEATLAVNSIYLQYGYIKPSKAFDDMYRNTYLTDAERIAKIKTLKVPLSEVSIPADTAYIYTEETDKFRKAFTAYHEKNRKKEEELRRQQELEELRAGMM